jgi:hypothetical protein
MDGSIDERLLNMYFIILSDAIQSSKPESTRDAALRSLQTFSPVLALALQNPKDSKPIVPAFFILLLFLSDDSFKIRQLASEISSSVLGEYLIFTPMAASERLAQIIGDAFDPECIEQTINPLISRTNVRQTLRSASDSSDPLFAKERENIWRDEIYLWQLYLRIVSICWSRKICLELGSYNDVLEKWATEGLLAVKEAIETNEDPPLGWSHDVDVFETVMKLLLMVEIILRYGCGAGLAGPIETVKQAVAGRRSHEVWLEKMEEISSRIKPVTSRP